MRILKNPLLISITLILLFIVSTLFVLNDTVFGEKFSNENEEVTEIDSVPDEQPSEEQQNTAMVEITPEPSQADQEQSVKQDGSDITANEISGAYMTEPTSPQLDDSKEAELLSVNEEAKPVKKSEDERLADLKTRIYDTSLDAKTDRALLYAELEKVCEEEPNLKFQKVIIDRLLSADTNQSSPYMGEAEAIVRVFRGFVMLDEDGNVDVYHDNEHLHFSEDWEIKAHSKSVETIEDNTVVWDLSVSSIWWALAEKEDKDYLFYWLLWEDVEGDPVYPHYNTNMRQTLKAIADACIKEDGISSKNRNILNSMLFQMEMKPTSEECFLQKYSVDTKLFTPSKEEREKNRYKYQLINFTESDGQFYIIDPSKPGLIVRKTDINIRVTLVE